MPSLVRRVLRHRVVHASALRVVALVSGVLSSVLISRLGGAEVKGVTSAFAASAIVGYTIANVDLAQQTLSFGRSTHTLYATRSRLLRVWPWYIALALLVAAGALSAGHSHVVWFAAGTLAYLLSGQMAIVCTGLSGPAVTAVGGIVQQLGFILATLAAVEFGRLDSVTAPFVVIFSFLAPLPLYLWAARPFGELDHVTNQHKAHVLQLLQSGVPWQAARLAQLLLLRLDTLFVFWFLGPSAAGIYSVGLATAGLAGLVPTQFASNALYEATLEQRSPKRGNLLRAGWSGLACAAGLAAVAWALLPIAYGREFQDSYVVMLGTLPGVVAYGVLQVFTNQTRLEGRARTVAVPSAAGVLAMVVGLLIATPTWGLIGAAAASSLGGLTALATVLLGWRIKLRGRTEAT